PPLLPGRYAGQTRHVDKTTAMNALRRAWEKQHGAGSVVGLAPSAVAAQVLGDDLGIATENTAKWWQNHFTRGETFQAGQLVIIDEASLAGTLSLDRITALAAQAGAKVLLVGDYGQLQSVDAGGAFGMLVADRHDDAPELVDVHRFIHEWEKTASLDLRHGRTRVIDTYLNHHRIADGDGEEMIDAAYAAWRADRDAGRVSVLIAETREDVTALNDRARADLILDGRITPTREVALAEGTRGGVGDAIITRRNDRRLRTGTGRDWVRNGETWRITDVRDDGSITIRKPGRRFGSIVLPADYVAEHVDLGYAVTAHRAQGISVDTAHVLVEPTTTRENFYVAMTRGKHSNQAYVVLDRPDPTHSAPHPSDNEEATGRRVLFGVLQHSGAEVSAHETITAEQEHWGSIAQLAAEYETIAAAAQHDRWATLIRGSGLSEEQAEASLGSEAFGALTAELRRAEANHHDLDTLFPRLVAARGFDDAEDVAKVMHYRLARATAQPSGSGRTRKAPRLIVGLIPHATGPMTSEMRQALTERRELIEARADAILDTALHGAELWMTALGETPADERGAARWRRDARTVAAYRDRYQVDDDAPLGPAPQTAAQKIDRARARAAFDRAQKLTQAEQPEQERARRNGSQRLGPTLQ
ncbi:ATP-dependent DNA helicase, partial [Microbacterium sp.]|uniref:ATP-dependent DNA helicase n=1 Tax=Microbacterium sp. TaxID=51671 RepID=UPI003F9902FC